MKKHLSYNDPPLWTKELKNGKETAFDHLFRTRYKNLCNFANTFTEDFDAAEDIVQEIFSNIWIKRSEITPPIDGYLYIAVRNASLSWLRDKKEQVNLEKIPQHIAAIECSNSTSAELQKLWNALEELPKQSKIIFKLVVLEDMSYQDVANYLNLSPNTVKTHMKFAYKTLREKLDPKQFQIFLLILKRKNTNNFHIRTEYTN